MKKILALATMLISLSASAGSGLSGGGGSIVGPGTGGGTSGTNFPGIVVTNNAKIGGAILLTNTTYPNGGAFLSKNSFSIVDYSNGNPFPDYTAHIDSQNFFLESPFGTIFAVGTGGSERGIVYASNLIVNNAGNEVNTGVYALDVAKSGAFPYSYELGNSSGDFDLVGGQNFNNISYSVNIKGGPGQNGYGGGSVNIQGGWESGSSGTGWGGGSVTIQGGVEDGASGISGNVNLRGGDGVYESKAGSAYVRGGNVDSDGVQAGNVLLSGGIGQSGSSASSITLNGTTGINQNGTISVNGDIITSLRVTGNFTNYVSNISTNTAPIYTSSASVGSYTNTTIYTNAGQRCLLVGSVVIPALSAPGGAGMYIRYTNNAVGYVVPVFIAHGNGASGTTYVPFSIPMSTGSTFKFETNTTGSAAVYVTNVVCWRL